MKRNVLLQLASGGVSLSTLSSLYPDFSKDSMRMTLERMAKDGLVEKREGEYFTTDKGKELIPRGEVSSTEIPHQYQFSAIALHTPMIDELREKFDKDKAIEWVTDNLETAVKVVVLTAIGFDDFSQLDKIPREEG